MAYSKKIGASRKSGMASKYGAKAGKRAQHLSDESPKEL